MPVPEKYVGVKFRQRAGELRWGKDGAKRTNRQRSEQPVDERTKEYIDSDENPTFVTFAADDNVDIEWLLRGAIEVWEPPKRAARVEPPPAPVALRREGSDSRGE